MESPDISRRQLLSRLGLTTAGGALLGAALPVVAEPAKEKPSSAAAPLNVQDLGAVGDGVTDNTDAFAAALKAAAEAGSLAVFVPQGHYLIKGTLAVPANVMLEGVFQGAPSR